VAGPFVFSDTLRLALGIEYDGSDFAGWQTQPSGAAVQDAVERALHQFSGERLRTVCAGRTDAGVHATYQVVHLDTNLARPLAAWVRGVNRYLPVGAAVRWVMPVPETFHARYGAVARGYDYWLLNDPVRSPLAARRLGWVYRPLDALAMQQAAALIVGRHDFSAFRSSQCQAASPVRELRELEVRRFGRCIRIRAVANAFLHHMVRNVVGALVYVGLGRRPPRWIRDVLDSRDRAAAAPTFAACGLYLVRVDYDPAFGLPAPHDYAHPSPE
jgi:tRNA pseudouridine38-40 synthase